MRHLKFLGLALSLALLAPAAQADILTYNGTGGPLTDATTDDEGVTNFDIEITGTGQTVTSIESVTLTGFSHSYLGDLSIFLVGPDEDFYSIITVPPGNASANFGGTYTFRVDPTAMTVDQAAAGKATGYTLPGGTYAISDLGENNQPGPRTTFDDLSGQPLDGFWTLQIIDSFEEESGSLGSWSFTATTVVPEPTSLAALGAAGTLLARRRRA